MKHYAIYQLRTNFDPMYDADEIAVLVGGCVEDYIEDSTDPLDRYVEITEAEFDALCSIINKLPTK